MENLQEKWLTLFGARLKSEREKQGLTQKTVAERAQTKQEYIAQIERGARNPSLRTVINLVSALDVSADYLIFGIHEEKMDSRDYAIKEFVSFLGKREIEAIVDYYEMVKFMAKYVDGYNDNKLHQNAE